MTRARLIRLILRTLLWLIVLGGGFVFFWTHQNEGWSGAPGSVEAH